MQAEIEKEIQADGFCYYIIRSSRRTMALEIKQDGRVLVRAPKNMAEVKIRSFVEEKTEWIQNHLEKINIRQSVGQLVGKLSEAKKGVYRRKARQLFRERTSYFANQMQVTFGCITIREQKTRWGSCSSAGNLNYNWKLVLAPPEVLDYVVVHELCHRKEMNHSKAFWYEVEQILPDYQQRRNWLRENGWKLSEL